MSLIIRSSRLVAPRDTSIDRELRAHNVKSGVRVKSEGGLRAGSEERELEWEAFASGRISHGVLHWQSS